MDTNLPYSQVGEALALEPIANQHWLGTQEGIGSLFVPWVGPMPQLQRSDPYEHRNVSTYTLPENYKGQNLYLRDTIEYNIITSRHSYIYKELLPIYLTDQVNLQWEHFEANAHLLDLNPYMTLAPLVSQKRQLMRAQLRRFGIQAEFERDFLGTPMGRQSFLAAANQIVNSTKESLNLEGTRALCTGHRQQMKYLRDSGMNPEQVQRYFLEEDRKRFAIVQKTKNGLEKLHVMIKKEMDRTGGIANAYVIPEEVAHFAQLVPEEKTDYYLAGPEGPNRINGVQGLKATGDTNGDNTRIEPLYLIRETPTFIAHDLQVEGASEAETQQFSRYRQIGEYVSACDTINDYTGYSSDWRSFEMYSQEVDDMVRLDLEPLILNSGIFNNDPTDKDGKVLPPGDYKSPGARPQDLDEDFLVFFVNGKRYPVQYIFDMAPEHLSQKKIMGGAYTLQQAMIRVGGPAVEAAIATLIRARNSNGGKAADQNTLTNELALVANAYFGIVPEANTALKIINGANEDLIYKWLVAPGKVPVTFTPGSGSDAPKAPAELLKSKINNAFIQAHLAATPATKRSEVESILRNEDVSLMERSEQVKQKLTEYIASGVTGLSFKSAENVEQWHAKRVSDYHDAIARNAPQQQQDVQYAEPGRPDKYSYVYSNSAVASSMAIERMTPLRQLIDKERSQVSAPMSRGMQTGEGFGLSNVGMMMEPRSNLSTQSQQFAVADRFATLEAHLKKLGGSDIQKAFAILYLCIAFNRATMLALNENNIVVPMNFLVLRPHMQYLTRAIVKCQRGGGTGFIFMGNSNLMMGWESDRMMARMHFVTHYRAVIVYPKNLYYQPDVFCQEIDGDVGGGGHRFYTPESYRNRNPDNLVDSLICCALPITETLFPEFLSITGRLPFQENSKLHYSTAERYRLLYGFGNIAGRVAGDIPSYGAMKTHDNLICCQGHQQNYVPGDKKHSKIIVCKGHWGKNVYAGCKQVRNGGLEPLEKQHYRTHAH